MILANDICERVVEYWKEHTDVLPEVNNMNPDDIEEIIDGIPDEGNEDLLGALSRLC